MSKNKLDLGKKTMRRHSLKRFRKGNFRFLIQFEPTHKFPTLFVYSQL